jgi:GntR family transcriptional regulator, transcriptional repressor for pyruvate dehydrogenase complex
VAAPLVDAAIERIRQLIASGQWRPGDRLPPEAELSQQLGVSRSSTREAVRALVAARVLDVRRGDGTFVTSLTPELLLEGIGVAVELVQEDAIVQLVETRRLIEPQVTALAAERASEEQLAEIHEHLLRMRSAREHAALVRHDSDFHASVGRASGNATLAAILLGISGPTLRARVWRGLIDEGADGRTVVEHEAIYDAIAGRDAALAGAAALLHVATTEAWVRRMVAAQRDGEQPPARKVLTPR